MLHSRAVHSSLAAFIPRKKEIVPQTKQTQLEIGLKKWSSLLKIRLFQLVFQNESHN